MEIDLNNPNVSTTLNFDVEEKETWTIDKISKSDFTVDELVGILPTIEKFKKKYPNDEFVHTFDEIVRDELCHMFGGKLNDEYED